MLAKLKSYLPYLIGVLLLLAVGIMKRQLKQSRHEAFREQNNQSMNELKESLKDLGSGNTTVRAKATP
ncbi:hypothetical protein D8B45_00645 [Candidatus Gracilibacteria bacterium]|nr:MAG: hypothetical protein D8B45_00645 [Candidatus Gracilibacteria bacterium]